MVLTQILQRSIVLSPKMRLDLLSDVHCIIMLTPVLKEKHCILKIFVLRIQ